MLTARQLVMLLLRPVGVTQISAQPEGSLQNSYDPSDGQEAVACVNGALQELYALAPRWFSHRPLSLAVNAPQTVTFTAAQGSATISNASPAGAFVRGCTLANASGDPIENEVVGSTLLLRPFQGPSGTVTATIYGDCLPLDATVAKVNPPVILEGYRELMPAATYRDLLDMDYRYRATFGNYGTSVAVTTRAQPRTVAQPLGYYVDTFFDPATGTMAFALRFVPMPDGAYIVRFEARLAPRVISVNDVGSDSTDPGTTFGLPNGWDESILLAIARQRWTGSTLFKNAAAVPEIQRAYNLAVQQLVPASRPQGVTPQRLKVGCH